MSDLISNSSNISAAFSSTDDARRALTAPLRQEIERRRQPAAQLREIFDNLDRMFAAAENPPSSTHTARVKPVVGDGQWTGRSSIPGG